MTDTNHIGPPSRVHFCAACKKPLRRIDGKKGPFWGCTGFPLCKTSLNDVDGKPSRDIDEHYRCPLCTRQLVRAAPEKGDYWFCSGFQKGCKVTLADHNGRPETAYLSHRCGHLLVKRKGKNGEFWGCREYPQCKTTYPDKNNRPDFDFFPAEHT